MFFKGILLPDNFCKNRHIIEIFYPYFFKTSSNSWGGALNPIHIGYILWGVHEEMGRRKDGAVSPAIGTILLVALTVVFVAVAAVVATGLANGMFDMKQVGLTLTPYGINSEGERGISLTVHGGADAGDLVSLSAALNGPELVYSDGTSSVKNPVIGKDYRFKAVESNVIIDTVRPGNADVKLETTEILPVNATEYYVTVTGTFRDGTEQVLLIQKVTLPAIPKSGSVSDAEGYVSVSPYSISDNYPAHGFIITVLDPKKYALDRTTATFTVTSHQKILDIKTGWLGGISPRWIIRRHPMISILALVDRPRTGMPHLIPIWIRIGH